MATGGGSAHASGADAHATLLLRYGAGASFEDKVAFLTEQLAALDPAKEWKRAVKSELAKPEYSANHLQSVRSFESPLLYCVLEKMGLVSALKRSVIDLHCATAQAVLAASAKQAKREEAFLIPEMRSSHGCSLDVVLSAREHWETITREEMLRFARETGRPLVALTSSASASNAAVSVTASQASTQSAADEQKTNAEGALEPTSSKPAKFSTTRFLYDGCAIETLTIRLTSSQRLTFVLMSRLCPPDPDVICCMLSRPSSRPTAQQTRLPRHRKPGVSHQCLQINDLSLICLDLAT